MNTKQLIELGFKDTSWTDGEIFKDHKLERNGLLIEVSGLDFVEVSENKEYVRIPNCKTISDLKDLIRLMGMEP